MLIFLRQSLITLLVGLQLFAPLVHAHAGKTTTEFGIHLPELEIFNRQAAVILQVADSLLDVNTLAVGIHVGMQPKPLKNLVPEPFSVFYALLPVMLLPKPKTELVIRCGLRAFSLAVPHTPVIPIRASRAPPVTAFYTV